MENTVDQHAIKAEISAQSKLIDGIVLNQALVTEIDAHIKEKENQLNEKLAHFPTKLMLKDFLPEIPINHMVNKVNDETWSSLRFMKNWRHTSVYEEISYDKTAKGYAFFYQAGEVTYDIGFTQGPVGMECYYRFIEDNRETFKVTGASVDIKLKAFKNLRLLISMIANQANHVTSTYFSGMSEINGNVDLSRKKVNLKEIGNMGQMEAIKHLLKN